MIKDNKIIEKKIYRLIVPILSLIPILSFFLPFIEWKDIDMSSTGFGVLLTCMSRTSESNEYVKILYILLAILFMANISQSNQANPFSNKHLALNQSANPE